MNTPAPAVLWLQSGYRQGCPPHPPLLPDWIFLCGKSRPSFSKEESREGDRQKARWSNWIIDVKSSLGETSSRVCLNRLTTSPVFAPVRMSKKKSAVAGYKLYFLLSLQCKKVYRISFIENMQTISGPQMSLKIRLNNTGRSYCIPV